MTAHGTGKYLQIRCNKRIYLEYIKMLSMIKTNFKKPSNPIFKRAKDLNTHSSKEDM